MAELTYDGPSEGATLILAHGAGAPMDHPFLETITGHLANAGVRVVRFEFPYMAARRVDGKKRGPNGAGILEGTWREVYAEVQTAAEGPVFIGGKSMGGRIASMLAGELEPAGLVCLGYPFHPPGKPDRLRTAHLIDLDVPTLILQGERDPFGTREEVGGYGLSEAIEVVWVEDGDHSFVPRKRAAATYEGNLRGAAATIVEFMASRSI